MRNVLRQPLTWMILAECVVVATLIMLAWHWLTAPSAPSAAAAGPPVISLPAPASDVTPAASPVVPVPSRTVARRLPGLNVDPGFWRLRLEELNRDQAAFEQLEWRIVRSAMDTVQRYLESVVLPSVERAERRS